MKSTGLNLHKLLFVTMLLVFALPGFAQTIIKGVVKDSKDGSSLPGVNITVKGVAGVGTTTGIDGTFSLKVTNPKATLQASFVGYATKEVAITGEGSLTILLESNNLQINEVVVTALGISRDKKSLSYSAQAVKSDELNTVKDANFTASIAGKASNVTINQGSGGVGSASNIVLRGNNSLSGSGQPLIVIDGIPTVNFNQRPSNGQSEFGQNYLAPDALSAMNSDNIDNVSILKGPAAAALYGSQAANGAIIITTKSGKDGVAKIDISSNTTFSKSAYTPKLQTSYAGNPADNGIGSWGAKDSKASNAKDFYNDFLQTGVNTSNTINLSAGNKNSQVFVSYANTYGKGLVPNNSLNRNNFDVKGNASFFQKFIELEAKSSYMQQTVKNPFAPGQYLNPYFTLMSIPADTDMKLYKDYETDDYPYQKWAYGTGNGIDNPWWDVNKVISTDKLSRLMSSASVKLNFTDYLNFTLRGTLDKTNENFLNKMYQGTTVILASKTGGFSSNTNELTQWYGDALLNFSKDVIGDNLHVNALLGTSIRDYSNTGINLNSNRVDMKYPNLFTSSNIDFAKGGSATDILDRRQIQSAFYSFELAYKNALFLTTTGRTDWSSTLPSNKNSYFYPSVGVSALLTELFSGLKSNTLNYLKVRLTYTQVGNDLPTYIVNPTATIGNLGALIPPTTVIKPGTTIKPEMTKSYEAGIDFNLLSNLIHFEGTFYKTNTTNQLFTIAAPSGSGYTNYYINGGNIENKGVELSLGVSPTFGDLKWNSTINFSKNINKVIELSNDVPEFTFSRFTNSSSYFQRIVKDGSLGDIYASEWARNTDGSLILNATTGLPTVAEARKIGNANPDFLLSWNNSFTYKGVRLALLVDGRFGGKIISLTDAQLDFTGNSKASASDRGKGYVELEGHKFTDVKAFYQAKGGLSGPLGEYAYDATTVRLRELSLGYSFRNMIAKTSISKYVKDINVSFIARNLFYFYKPAPIDPELVTTNTQGQNGYVGLELYNLPATRNIGFGVNISF